MKTLWFIKLIRPKQWVKNFFVFFPLLYTGYFTQADALNQSVIGFVVFCLGASSIYILNDINDRESDSLHPKKRKSRPLASGKIKVNEALALLIVLLTILGFALTKNQHILKPMAAYLILNVAYTLYLKKIPVVDIFCIAIGFVLRVWVGALCLNVPLSSWMFVTTLCLALFLAAIKRRQELLHPGQSIRRDVLKQYNKELIDKIALITSTSTLIFYTLFVVLEKNAMIITVPFVLFGILRYWFIVEINQEGESPTETLLKDKPLIVVVATWSLLSAYIIIGGQL